MLKIDTHGLLPVALDDLASAGPATCGTPTSARATTHSWGTPAFGVTRGSKSISLSERIQESLNRSHDYHEHHQVEGENESTDRIDEEAGEEAGH